MNAINKNDDRGALIQLKPYGTLDLAFGENGIFYTSLENEIHSTMSIHGMESNKIIVSNGLYATLGTILNRYILDLSIGMLNPQDNSEKEWLIYPNPIANDFTLNFSLVATESISIALFDMNGKLIKRLIQNQRFDAGEHKETYRLGQEMPAGNYLLTISMRGKPISSVQIVKK
ncbi:MAG: T9SS type A sorting domain-containing protein [Phycisphaerae bacterium]|nr:T9SS type A sorting domain-containing protein [Saprospiraceae bacterium]